MNLTIYLASLGLVWIIKDSYIFSIPREFLKSKSKHLNEFLSCSLCLGFWLGLFFCFLNNSEEINHNYIYYPLSVSAFCWFIDSLLDLIQYQSALSKKKFDYESKN